MKRKFLAAALAALTLGAVAAPAGAQDYGRHRDNGYVDTQRGEAYREWNGNSDHRRWRYAQITIRKDGRVFTFDRDDRMFYRLLDRPFNFRPGLIYQYTDRCNRHGCIVFVYSPRSRRPIDRIFAPHPRLRQWAYREHNGFDPNYRAFGDYRRSERAFDNQWSYNEREHWQDDDRRWDEYEEYDNDDRLEGGPRRR